MFSTNQPRRPDTMFLTMQLESQCTLLLSLPPTNQHNGTRASPTVLFVSSQMPNAQAATNTVGKGIFSLPIVPQYSHANACDCK